MKSNFKYYLVLFIANLIFKYEGGECVSIKQAIAWELDKIDPLSLPPNLGGGPAPLISDGELLGLKRTNIKTMKVDFKKLKGSFDFIAPELVLTSKYSWPCFVDPDHKYEGDLRYSFTALQVTGDFSLKLNHDDLLDITDLHIKILMDNMELNMTDISPEQRLMLAFGDAFICEITDMITRLVKPVALDGANKFMRDQLNSFLPPTNDYLYHWSANIGPQSSDVAFFMRRIIQKLADPFWIPGFTKSWGGSEFKFSGSQIEGTSFIGEVETFSVEIKDNILHLQLSMTYPHIVSKAVLRFILVKFFGVRIYFIMDMIGIDFAINMVIDPSKKEPTNITYFRFHTSSFIKRYPNSQIKEWLPDVANYYIEEFDTEIKKELQRALNELLA